MSTFPPVAASIFQLSEKGKKMKRIFAFSLFILCFSFVSAFHVAAQPSNIVKGQLSQSEIDEIVKKFTAHEKEFRSALTQYVFNRKAKIQIIGMGGQIAGSYERDSFMALTAEGERIEKILRAPIATTPPGFVTPEDLEDLGGVNPFAIEPSAINQYNFTYLGKEKIDELSLHVFEVTPKVIPDPKKSTLRLFTGRIWVDDQDFMIVKSKGKAVPEGKDSRGQDQRFPVVETWRENIDGKYWFPSLATSDDELVFSNGSVVKIRMRVRFENYGQGKGDVKLLDEPEETKPTPTPTPKKP